MTALTLRVWDTEEGGKNCNKGAWRRWQNSSSSSLKSTVALLLRVASCSGKDSSEVWPVWVKISALQQTSHSYLTPLNLWVLRCKKRILGRYRPCRAVKVKWKSLGGVPGPQWVLSNWWFSLELRKATSFLPWEYSRPGWLCLSLRAAWFTSVTFL